MRMYPKLSESGGHPTRWFAIGLLLGVVAIASASRPLDPLPAPLYSFDISSPAAIDGFVGANDVLALNDPYPQTIAIGASLGLGVGGDDLDSISGNISEIAIGDTFLLLFSVDRFTTGEVEPLDSLIDAEVPYNVQSQAAREQAAGDQFATTSIFDDQGMWLPPLRLPSNNSLVRNNYNEGGTDFSARPPVHARDVGTGDPQDRVDATASVTPGSPLRSMIHLYYTAEAESPSLLNLPGEFPSGANVYFNEVFLEGSPPKPQASETLRDPTLFVSVEGLFLQPQDDIDALVVFDRNANGLYDGTDMILFSLTPSSPSLGMIQGVSAMGPGADILVGRPGMVPEVFARAEDLGLMGLTDNVDALEVLAVEDAVSVLPRIGIRAISGDWDDDGDLDGLDFLSLNYCIEGPDIIPTGQWCELFDFNGDADADLADFAMFQLLFTGDGTSSVIP